MRTGLADARVVVSGGSSGMGLAAARVFGQEGARVAILGRDRARLEAAADTVRSAGALECLTLAADVTDGPSVVDAFTTVRETWGSLNALVNAVGPETGVGRFETLTDEDWIATLQAGLLSAVRCVRAALPLLRAAAWGRIVNISAHSTRRQAPELVAYTAAKAAMTSLSKNLAKTLAPEDILVNTVSPGSFRSESLRGYLAGLPPERNVDPDDLHDAMRVIAEDFGHPAFLPRAGDPAEIGPVIAFVASPLNSYMTGADINVDGGSDF